MNFNQLKYIIAVDRHRNFSRAAEELDIAQSTLSKEIQRLEQEFGIIIFDRSRYPVAPTMKGEDIISQAKFILDEQRIFVEIANKKENRPMGSFHLAILPMLAPYLLPLFITTLSRKYPELNLEIEELSSREIVNYFEDNHLDGAITLAPFIKDGFYVDPVFEEKFILYVSLQHPIAEKKEVAWSDIPFDELILHEELRKYFLDEHVFERKPKELKNLKNISYHSGSLETIRKIIDRNGGLTLLPELACIYMGNRRLRMVRPIKEPGFSREIALVTSRGFEKKRITKVIRREILGNLPVKRHLNQRRGR